jgi:Cupin domain
VLPVASKPGWNASPILRLLARLVPPHVHEHEDEISYVLEGRFGVRVGDFETLAGPGSYIVKPRRVPHTFWNPGHAVARLIEFIEPSGFERFFDELGALAAAQLDDFAEGRAALGARYDLHFLPEWVDDLKQRHSLRLLGE